MKKALKVIAIILAILLLIGLWLSPWNRIPVPGYREHWPALVLDCGDSGLVTAGQAGGWEVKYLSGMSSVSQYCFYSSPLSEESNHKTLALKEPDVQFQFTVAPKDVSIIRWNADQMGNEEAKSEEVFFKMSSSKKGTFQAEKGYLYGIIGHWKGGTVEYYFFTE